jgi:DNA polymerase III subunit alpha
VYLALRNHTPYSLLEGAIPIPSLLAKAQEAGMSALGIADSGHLFGGMEFSLACQKKGIQPIIGCTLLVRPDPQRSSTYPLTLYAKSTIGYQNLCHLVTCTTVGRTGAMRGQLYLDELLQTSEGLVLLTGGPEGMLDSALMRENPDAATQLLDQLLGSFGDRLYIELMRLEPALENGHIAPEVSDQRLETEKSLIDLAYAKGVPLIATNPALFAGPQDWQAHDALRCIALGRYIAEEDRPRASRYGYFRTPQEMELLFADVPEALANTQHLAIRCSFMLRAQTPVLPAFPGVESEEEALRQESQSGLEIRLLTAVFPLHPQDQHHELRQRYQDQLTYECDMIIRMGFAGYFLIVSDFIRWAKANDIPVGPGRGSGAGALVAWALSITDVDPLRFGLFFERFLNPDRVSMPDFDVDFCQDRRDEVIAYVQARYGADRVAHIITFGTLQARAVLRDVGRVLQLPYPQVDRICKLVPQNPANPVNLQEALRLEPQLRAEAQDDPQVQTLLDIALKLEGLYRHASTHAAGVIIGRSPLEKTLPLYQDEDAHLPAVEYSFKYVESAGLVKFDFLGLKTLTVMQTAVRLAAQRGISIDLTTLPLDDEPSFALLRRCQTVGLFQLESAGMTDVLRQLQPQSFEEIIALVALYRPGPMDDIPRYIACRHGREQATYAYPCMHDILKESFGVMVYQEQVLQIARTLAGYTLGAADLLRRAMGKKIKSEMDAQRKIFIEGAVGRYPGTQQTASDLFDQITKFAGYAFPKAHATPYALISYQTAYLKANVPVQFMTALMIHDAHNTDKLRLFVREAIRMNITLAPPDINLSQATFCVQDQTTIRYGLGALRGVGTSVMEKVQAERAQNGPYPDFFTFVQRTVPLGINKKGLDSLIAAGAFDSLYADKRSQLMASVEPALRAAAGISSGHGTMMDTLFAVEAPKLALTEAPPWSTYESLAHELEAVGFYLSAHPLDPYVDGPFTLREQLDDLPPTTGKTGRALSMAGMVMKVAEKVSKSGKKFAIVELSDPTGSYEVMIFADLLAEVRPHLKVGRALFFSVEARQGTDSLRLSATAVSLLEDALSQDTLDLHIHNRAQANLVHEVLSLASQGRTTVRLHVHLDGPLQTEDKSLSGRCPSMAGLKATLILPGQYRLSPAERSRLETLVN